MQGMSRRFPVHPMTRFGLACIGAYLGLVVAIRISFISQSVAWVLLPMLTALGAARGAFVRVVLADQ